MKAHTRIGVFLCTALCALNCAAPSVSAALPGDVNGDSRFDLLDVIALQKWMLSIQGASLQNWEAADLCKDDVIDIFDLALMKRSLLHLTASQPEADAQSGIYTEVTLYDADNPKIAAYQGLLPVGWTAEVNSAWRICNAYPGRETAVIVSPDHKAWVEITSPIAYSQDTEHSDGENWEALMQYRAYQTAAAYADDVMTARHDTDAELSRTLDILPMQQEVLERWTQNNADAVENIGLYELQGAEATAVRQQYKLPGGAAEIACGVSAIQYGRNIGAYTISFIDWEVPYTVIYEAKDEGSFEAYYHDYEIIACNFSPTYDFQLSMQFVRQRMTDGILRTYDDFPEFFAELPYKEDIRDEATEAQEAMLRSMMHGLTDGRDFQGNMINVRTARAGEIVAEKDGSIYIGIEAQMPDGFTVLTQQ